MHARISPKKYAFNQKMFMFYLDLDEIDDVAKQCRLFSRNQFNLFNFADADHFPGTGVTIRENFFTYLRSQGVSSMPEKVRVLTHVRVLGYIFNPVSFYYCFDEQDKPTCLVAEVGNTFGEQKPYFLGSDKLNSQAFMDRQLKHFYISPFVPLDAQLDFHVEIPQDTLLIRVDDWKDGDKFFISTVSGQRIPLCDKNLVRMGLRYPLVTLQVITMIHWHAFRLWSKGVPHHKKEESMELQKGLSRARN